MNEKIEITTTAMNKLIGKLRVPIHIDYISTYILRDSIENTRKILIKLIENGMIEESSHSNDYYVLKTKGNE
jgi:hypothetical protein